MCGITGFWNLNKQIKIAEPKAVIQKMADAIMHRGPDSSGIWYDENAEIYFGHRRLAIIDLSAAGHQPMTSRSGLSTLSYNGEIYNTDELRKQLIAAGCEFRGYSDTEVILEGCELWGVEKTLQNMIGMFAFSFWDVKKQQLILARDRVGKKPLYWGFQNGVLLFASELKALTVHPCWSARIDRDALASYFDYNYVSTPSSIYQGIQKLKPGALITIHANKKIEEKTYWNFHEVAEQSLIFRDMRSDFELEEALDLLLRDAVKRRMISDVPLAAFLSGGIDSSLIVALMQVESTKPIKTFSIGFLEEGYNEAVYAAAVAKHLGTEHHELYLQAEEAQSIIPKLPEWFDEPFADVSQIPTFLVSKLARQQVTVSLSGDGGDELFAGYNRYFLGNRLWHVLSKIPKPLRSLLESSLLTVSPSTWDRISAYIPIVKNRGRLGDRLHKLATMLSADNADEYYQLATSHWGRRHALVNREVQWVPKNNQVRDYLNLGMIEKMQYLDTLSYLPDDILTKVDRASMAVSLEARAPFLDHRVIEFAWTLPMKMKVRDGKGKWLLRSLLKRYVPTHLIERPKMGFGVPIDTWLRGPLREWAESLLSETALRQDNILNPLPIRQRWQEHLSGKRNWQYSLWGVLMFQAWREKWAVNG